MANINWVCPDHDQTQFYCIKEGDIVIHHKRHQMFDAIEEKPRMKQQVCWNCQCENKGLPEMVVPCPIFNMAVLMPKGLHGNGQSTDTAAGSSATITITKKDHYTGNDTNEIEP